MIKLCLFVVCRGLDVLPEAAPLRLEAGELPGGEEEVAPVLSEPPLQSARVEHVPGQGDRVPLPGGEDALPSPVEPEQPSAVVGRAVLHVEVGLGGSVTDRTGVDGVLVKGAEATHALGTTGRLKEMKYQG